MYQALLVLRLGSEHVEWTRSYLLGDLVFVTVRPHEPAKVSGLYPEDDGSHGKLHAGGVA